MHPTIAYIPINGLHKLFCLMLSFLPFFVKAQTCSVSIVKQQDAGCIQGLGGNIQVRATGNAPFSYTWSNGKSGSVLENVPAGTYTVTVKDAKGCIANKTVVLLENKVSLKTSISGNTLTLLPEGKLLQPVYKIVSIKGNLIKEQESPSFNIPKAGKYIVAVVDNQGCAANSIVEIK